MTRIIAGAARGRRLKVPGSLTRPTSDRVRESLFASLQTVTDLDGARVLDLFAGSGALGLEALSRGASQVTLVERAPSVVKVIAENITAVGLPGVTCERSEVRTYLRGPARPHDVVFLDPPYDMTAREVDEVLELLGGGWLSEGAVVVVERGDDTVRWPEGFADHWQRSFGGTHVLRAVWYRRISPPPIPRS